MFFRQFLATKNQNQSSSPITPSNVQLSEYAALCSDVAYNVNDPLRPTLPQGWSRILDSGQVTTGYFGALYVKNENQPTDIVFAHRAALPTQAKNLTNNIRLAFKKIPNLYLSAEIFLGRAIDFLIRKYGEANLQTIAFSSTGHSFGGVLAEICSAYFIPVVTFENPGSKESLVNIYRYELQNFANSPEEIEKLLKSGLQLMRKNCLHYCNDINIFNTATDQVGNSFLLKPMHYDYVFNDQHPLGLEQVNLQSELNSYYLNSYSLQQHQISEICHKLSNPINLQYIKLPVGFQNGYQAYLDYETRKNYWDAYAQHYWQQHELLHSNYNDDFQKYKTEFIQQLKLLKQAVVVPQEAPEMDGEDNLSLLVGGFSLFAHPENKSPPIAKATNEVTPEKENKIEEDFQLINKDHAPKSDKHHRSNCSIM